MQQDEAVMHRFRQIAPDKPTFRADILRSAKFGIVTSASWLWRFRTDTSAKRVDRHENPHQLQSGGALRFLISAWPDLDNDARAAIIAIAWATKPTHKG